MRANSSFGPREACQAPKLPKLPSLVNASVEIVLSDVVCTRFSVSDEQQQSIHTHLSLHVYLPRT